MRSKIASDIEKRLTMNIQSDLAEESTIEDHKKYPKFVTDVGLAMALGLSVHTIRKWRCQGRIKPYEFGRSVRYVVDEVVAMLINKRN